MSTNQRKSPVYSRKEIINWLTTHVGETFSATELAVKFDNGPSAVTNFIRASVKEGWTWEGVARGAYRCLGVGDLFVGSPTTADKCPNTGQILGPITPQVKETIGRLHHAPHAPVVSLLDTAVVAAPAPPLPPVVNPATLLGLVLKDVWEVCQITRAGTIYVEDTEGREYKLTPRATE